MAIEQAVIKFFDYDQSMEKCKIEYTFFCPYTSMTTTRYEDGRSFFHKILKEHGEHNFDAHINIELSRMVEDERQEWGTQIHLAYGYETWMGIDEDTEYPVYLLFIENEQVTIDETFSPQQVTNIAASVVGQLARCYALDYEAC